MKRFLVTFLAALVISTSALAAGNDLRVEQRNGADTANLLRSIPFPSASANGLLVFDGVNTLPKAATFGTGISYNGTSVVLSGIAQSSVTNLTTDLAGKEPTITAGTSAQYYRGDKIMQTLNKAAVGLGNVDNTADASKAFTAAQTTSGTFADARVAQSNVTQHQAALSIAASQITGTKTSSFISDFGTASRAAAQMYSGTTQKLGAFPLVKTVNVSSGTAVFYLTADNLSTGTAIYPNGADLDSVQVIVNDATASYQLGWAFSNSNKTLTVTCNYYTTANILTGILGQSACPNGKAVKLVVWGN